MCVWQNEAKITKLIKVTRNGQNFGLRIVVHALAAGPPAGSSPRQKPLEIVCRNAFPCDDQKWTVSDQGYWFEIRLLG
jgi:hypothetical protein